MYILDKFDNNTYLEEYLKEYRREVYIRLIKSPRKRIIRELNAYSIMFNYSHRFMFSYIRKYYYVENFENNLYIKIDVLKNPEVRIVDFCSIYNSSVYYLKQI